MAGLAPGSAQGLEKAAMYLRDLRMAGQNLPVDGEHAPAISSLAQALERHAGDLPGGGRTSGGGMSAEDVYAYIRSRGAVYGTAAAIEETIEQYFDAGCGGFVVFCNSAPWADALEQVAALPTVRRAIRDSLSRSYR